jgi:hypothetical protein
MAVRWDLRASRRPDRDQPGSEFRTMDDLLPVSLCGIALVLAAMRFGGVTVYARSESTRQIGIRMALARSRKRSACARVGNGTRGG